MKRGTRLIAAVFLLLLLFFLVGCTTNVEGKQITVKMGESDVTGQYTGVLKGNLADGAAVFTVSTSEAENWTYRGSFENGAMIGVGSLENCPLTIEFNGHTIAGKYTGPIENGIISGEGTFQSEEDDDVKFSYDGNFRDGLLFGKGTLDCNCITIHFPGFDRDGVYSGDVIDGVPNGSGRFSATNDSGVSYTYDGEWKNGLFDGKGKTVYDSDTIFSSIGHYTKGEFTPDQLDLIISLGTSSNLPFSVPESAQTFIVDHADLFPASDISVLDEYVDADIGYKQLIKTPTKYGNALIKVTGYHVQQIWEYELWGYAFSELIVTNSNYSDYYYVFYPSSSDGIYEDSNITIYALPINGSAYSTTIGGTNNCYVLFACDIR